MIEITYNKKRTIRTIADDLNPRIYYQEFSCKGCGIWINEDGVIWADEKGNLTMHGNPYCDNCLPTEE
jgi:hypothetical protein